jgi:hypothetical protein
MFGRFRASIESKSIPVRIAILIVSLVAIYAVHIIAVLIETERDTLEMSAVDQLMYITTRAPILLAAFLAISAIAVVLWSVVSDLWNRGRATQEETTE